MGVLPESMTLIKIDDTYEEIISEPNYLGKMKSVYNKMVNNDKIGFFSEYTNPVYLADIPKDERFFAQDNVEAEEYEGISFESFDGKTDTYYDVNGIWMGKGGLETYGIVPESGRSFTDEDFEPIHSGDTVAIILGADYKEYYKLGDHIKGDMFIANVQFEVVGFFEKGAAIKLIDMGKSTFKELDDLVMIPLCDYPNEIDPDDFSDQSFIYGMKIC